MPPSPSSPPPFRPSPARLLRHGVIGFALVWIIPVIGVFITGLLVMTNQSMGLLAFLPALLGVIIAIAIGFSGVLFVGLKASKSLGNRPDGNPTQDLEDAVRPLVQASGRLEKERFDAMGVDVEKIAERLAKGNAPSEIVKLRCRACAALNDEAAKFCQQCGKPV